MVKEFLDDLAARTEELKTEGLFKAERVITSQQQADIIVTGGERVLNFCANNYLGLANHPELIKAAQAGGDVSAIYFQIGAAVGLSQEDILACIADPQMNERFLRVVDEGIFQRPGGLPARRVRHFFMDETLWSHPESDTRILSTTPREEVILIELDTY